MHPGFGLHREKQINLFYYTSVDPNMAPHFHSQIELYLVKEGEFEVWINGKRRILQPGEMAVSFSYDAHGYQTFSHVKARLLILPLHLCGTFPEILGNRRLTEHYVTDTALTRQIEEWFDGIECSEGNSLKQSGYIQLILGTLLDALATEEREERVDTELSSRILFYLNEHFREPLDLSHLAATFGYHPAYLSRYFKSCFSVGIHQYINVLRLKEALRLLTTKKYNVTYCALESGFSSVRTFYRVFWDEFGCTPSEYSARVFSSSKA